jgi:hypothetical protein
MMMLMVVRRGDLFCSSKIFGDSGGSDRLPTVWAYRVVKAVLASFLFWLFFVGANPFIKGGRKKKP